MIIMTNLNIIFIYMTDYMKKYMKNIPFLFVIIIIFHHYIKHSQDKNLSLSEKFFQYKDINNHETWALFLLGIGIGVRISEYYK